MFNPKEFYDNLPGTFGSSDSDNWDGTFIANPTSILPAPVEGLLYY